MATFLKKTNAWPIVPILAGLLLVLGLSLITVDVPGRGPTERNYIIGRLDQNQRIEQVFIADQPTIRAIQVLLFPNPAGSSNGSVTMSLRRLDAHATDLARVSLPLSQLARNGMTTFVFPPIQLQHEPYGLQTILALTLTADVSPDDSVTVLAGPNSLSGSYLRINGNPKTYADLAFQPVYMRYWIDDVLPVSQMAMNKPVVFGWPPFYSVAFYVYFVLLVLGLFRLARLIYVPETLPRDTSATD
jgi:hypothetical protein